MKTEITTPTGVRKEITKGDITVDNIHVSEYQKPGTKTAQLRQTIVTVSHYPSTKTETSMSANIFDNEEFGFESKDFESVENRVAWIPVPEKALEADVFAKVKLAVEKGATIYRVLSNAPILDENQEYAIAQGFKTKDDFAKTQVVRFPENEATIANGTAGKLTLDPKGLVQYRRTFFWLTPKEDLDVRGNASYPAYAPEELLLEVKADKEGASAMKGQTIM